MWVFSVTSTNTCCGDIRDVSEIFYLWWIAITSAITKTARWLTTWTNTRISIISNWAIHLPFTNLIPTWKCWVDKFKDKERYCFSVYERCLFWLVDETSYLLVNNVLILDLKLKVWRNIWELTRERSHFLENSRETTCL